MNCRPEAELKAGSGTVRSTSPCSTAPCVEPQEAMDSSSESPAAASLKSLLLGSKIYYFGYRDDSVALCLLAVEYKLVAETCRLLVGVNGDLDNA